MRIFVAGATGVLGRRLIPMLVSAHHEVIGTTRSRRKVASLGSMGAEPVVVDALNGAAMRSSVRAARPQVIVHELTALEGKTDIRAIEDGFELTNRLRTQGTDILLSAAREAGVHRLVAQSFTGWPNDRTGGPIKNEDDPLDRDPPDALRGALDAIEHLEREVAHARGLEGIALRYGTFYGPGTTLSEGGEHVEQVRRRRFPLVGQGDGVWSFVHIDDAASATMAAIEGARRASTTSSTTSPLASSNGCLPWPRRTAPSRRDTPPFGSPAWCRARPA